MWNSSEIAPQQVFFLSRYLIPRSLALQVVGALVAPVSRQPLPVCGDGQELCLILFLRGHFLFGFFPSRMSVKNKQMPQGRQERKCQLHFKENVRFSSVTLSFLLRSWPLKYLGLDCFVMPSKICVSILYFYCIQVLWWSCTGRLD